MTYNPKKSELLHFTRKRTQPKTKVHLLGPREGGLAPVTSARFLGVWLDSKLSFQDHGKQIKRKLETQSLALSRLAGKTWGVKLLKAREIYTKVIRSMICYGAGTWHTPTEKGGNMRGIAKKLDTVQSKCLRTVIGAYKATPVRNVETEAWCPPIDLQLSQWVAKTEQRLEKSGMARLLRELGPRVASILKMRRARSGRERAEPRLKRPPKNSGLTKSAWAKEWLEAHIDAEERPARLRPEDPWPPPWTEIQATTATEAEWHIRRQKKKEIAAQRSPRNKEAADTFDIAEDGATPPLQLHEGLPKAKSSLLTQIRTGAIGLNAFLFKMNVPGTTTPRCRAGCGNETAPHVILRCRTWEEERRTLDLGEIARDGDGLRAALSRPETARKVAAWMVGIGRLKEYALFAEFEEDEGYRAEEVEKRNEEHRKERANRTALTRGRRD
jgi:hypothetical protein